MFDAPAAAPVEGEGEAQAEAAEGKAKEEQAAAAAAAAQEDAGLNFEDLLAEFKPQDTGALKDSGPKKAPTRRK